MLLRHRRELELDVLEAQRPVHLAHHLEIQRDLVLDLIFAAEDVRVVLRHRAHPHQAVQRARAFRAMQPAELREAQRQVAIRALLGAIHERMPGAIHRLEPVPVMPSVGTGVDRMLVAVGIGREKHILAEIFPMSRRVEHLVLENQRRDDLVVAVAPVQPPHVVDERIKDDDALGQVERRARRDRIEDVQAHLAPELAMVALAGELDQLEMLLERFLAGERGAVDSREHRVVLVAAPIRARDAGQLECLQVARRRHVRSAAKIHPVALAVDGNRIFGLVDYLDLVLLAHRREFLDGLFARDFGPRDLVVSLRQLAHLRFDLRQILDRERRGRREVVEKAVFDDRSNRHLRAGIERLHRHRHQMRRRMTDYLETLGRVGQHRLDRGVMLELARQIDELAVDARGHQVFARNPVLQHVANDSANRHDAAIRRRQLRLRWNSSSENSNHCGKRRGEMRARLWARTW